MSATCSASWEPPAARRRLAEHVPSHCSNQIPPNRLLSSSHNYSLWHTFDDCGTTRILLCFLQDRNIQNAEGGRCTPLFASTDTWPLPRTTHFHPSPSPT